MDEDLSAGKRPTTNTKRFHPIYLLPIAIVSGIIAIFSWGLTQDSKILPSVLIDKPVPEFRLPPVKDRKLGLASEDLHGGVSLVNVFASWCIPCRVEHPLLMEISRQNIVAIHGLNYKDKPDEASAWLDELGDPYTRTGADVDGRVGIEWGVYGVPETFVIGKDGRIAFKHVGPLTPKIFKESILPVIERLKQ